MVLAVIVISGLIPAQSQTPSEYQLKAAFICLFPKFIDWPSHGGTDPNGPIVIGMLGQDRFVQEMEAVMYGRVANSRPLVTRRFSNLKGLARCHILFVSSSERNNLKQILAAVAGLGGVLTVADTDRFADAGGVIQMNMIGGKVRLVINQAAAERAGLRISAKMLELADVIRK